MAGLPLTGRGQLYSDAPYQTTTDYSVKPARNDRIFIFSGQEAVLKAKTRDTSHVPHVYVWTKYNTGTKNFTDTLQIDSSAIDSSQLIVSTAGCYQVDVSADTNFRAWVFFDSLDFRIDSVRSLCSHFIFRITVLRLDTFQYIDLTKPDSVMKIKNRVEKIRWKYEGQEQETSSYTFYADPPTDTTTYWVTLTNTFKHQVTRNYKAWVPLATRAKFRLLDDGEPLYKIDTLDPSGGAPLRVRFLNQSRNGKIFEWYFKAAYTRPDYAMDTTCQYPPIPISDTTYTEVVHWRDLKDTVAAVFYSPGTYTIKLVSKNNTCDPDTFTFISASASSQSLVYSLKVNKSSDELIDFRGALPEVFNPNVFNFMFTLAPKDKTRSDVSSVNGITSKIEQNDFSLMEEVTKWAVTERSMRKMKISILDRWGREVYRYEGPLETEDNRYWDGWNGKVYNKGADCEPGIYYWVLELEGWDNVYYRDKLRYYKTKTSNTGTTSSSSAQESSSGQKETTYKNAKFRPEGRYTGFVYLVR